MTKILQEALKLDREVAASEKSVSSLAPSCFIEPQSIKLLAPKGLEVESGHVTASVGLHVVLGRNHAGKTRLLRTVAAGQFCLTIPALDLSPTLSTFDGIQDIIITLIWRRNRSGSANPASDIQVNVETQSKLGLRSKLTDISPLLDRAIRDYALKRIRIRPAIVVPTERYLHAQAKLESMPSSLDDLAAFPAILENLRRDILTRPLFAKINEAFQDVTEGLSLEFMGTGGISHLHVVEQDGTLVPIEQCGDGLRDLLVILTYLHVYERCDLMLDEPGLRLHPHAQRRLLRYLEGGSRRRAIWIASHDGVFVGAPSVRSRYLVTRDTTARISKVSALPDETQVRRAVAHLGWAPRDALLAERVLLCEGEADAIIFRAVLDRLAAEEPEMGGTLVAELGGDGRVWSRNREALELIEMLRLLSPHAHHVLIVDPGDASKRANAEGLVRFYQEKGVHLHLLALNELENYFLTPSLARELLALTVRLGRWPDGELPPEPSEADVAIDFGGIDPVNEKGSGFLDRLSRRLLNRGYKKTEGARWAAELLPIHAPGFEKMLRQELRAALTTT